MVAEQQQQQQQRDEPLVCKDIPVHGKYLMNKTQKSDFYNFFYKNEEITKGDYI